MGGVLRFFWLGFIELELGILIFGWFFILLDIISPEFKRLEWKLYHHILKHLELF